MARILGLAVAATLLTANAAIEQDASVQTNLAELRSADIRVAGIMYRLNVANGSLCRHVSGKTGLVLHALTSYNADIRDDARRFFHFHSPVAVEGIIPGSPADGVGLHADDSLVRIDGQRVMPGQEGQEVAAVEKMFSRHNGPVKLEGTRGSGSFTAVLTPVMGCDARVQLRISEDENARTDGKVIQIDTGLLNTVGNDDGAIAVSLAHELAHIVLEHPRRLDEAGVSRGLFKALGRSGRLFKKTEEEADRLSVSLLTNAGYDPGVAAIYWRRHGAGRARNPLFGRTHLRWQDRARMLEAEARRIRAVRQRPIIPDSVRHRDEPLR